MAEDRPNLFLISPHAVTEVADGRTGAAPAAVIGSKAAGLQRLARLGLPVPPAFVLGTGLCRDYWALGGRLPGGTRELLAEGLAQLERAAACGFGSTRRPLLVSVRSGAPISMPGMLQTILNVGLGEQTLRGMLRSSGNPRQAYDCYRRLVRDYTEVVHGADADQFDALLARRCALQSLDGPSELDSKALAELADESLQLSLALTGRPFPQEPLDQLIGAVEAVLRSWNDEKAVRYRRINGIDDAAGTAVTVQAMVFGNNGMNSGAGVGFTRDPATGENRPYLDFLFNAQGEDVVSGRFAGHETAQLAERLPLVAAELARIRTLLEAEFHDMQDFEFTVECGRLYLLQTRAAKRTPWAALRIAVDMVGEGLITPAQALLRLEGIDLERLERLHLITGAGDLALASAVPAGIGVARGVIAFDSRSAATRAARGESVILVRPDISTADVEGIAAADGVLTAAGSRTSHAAVVARQLGKVCLVNCQALRLQPNEACCMIGAAQLREGDALTLDGDTGSVYAGNLSVEQERPLVALEQISTWRTAEGGGLPSSPTPR
jgi:pyruvate,orthophosphate dikinase